MPHPILLYGVCLRPQRLDLIGYFPTPILPSLKFGRLNFRSRPAPLVFLIQLFDPRQLFQKTHQF